MTARITSIRSDLANAPEPSPSHALRSDSRKARDSHRRQTTQHLFEELGDSSDAARRRTLNQRIVEANMPVAASIARRYVGRGEGQEDLEQVAYVGLSKAVMGFDPTLDKDFLSYAVPTITGEIKKHFRDHCWSVRPPRRIQELQAQISGAHEALVQDLGGAPTSKDLAGRLNIDERDVAEALGADGCFSPSSLDTPVGDETSTSVGDMIGQADPEYERREGHLLLTQLLRELSARDREILNFRFVDDWTQDRIARRLGVTQMQVSRLLSRILKDLGSAAA